MNGRNGMHSQHKGFTLTELMITVAIVATMAAIAVPSYRQYVMRANRADATAALLRLASQQERFYLQNNTYATEAELADAPPDGLGMPGTERGFYELSIDAPDPTVGYEATATAVAGEDQEDDTDCRSFTVNAQGVRSALDASNGDNTERCWR